MAGTSQLLQQEFINYRNYTNRKLQLIEEKMDYFTCRMNELLTQRGLNNENFTAGTNEEDDVQWRRRNNCDEENKKVEELKHHKFVFPSFTEGDNASNWIKDCDDAIYEGAPIYDDYVDYVEAPVYDCPPTCDEPPQCEGNCVFDHKAEFIDKIQQDEWKNFLARIGRYENTHESELNDSPNDILKLRFWTLYHGQTLSRTVRGMMYNEKALMLQIYLERMTSEDVEAAVSRNEASDTQGFELSPEARAQADLKFTYVVTCQINGKQKEEAADIALLMQRNEVLRVSFIDMVETMKDGIVQTEFYSKLVTTDINGKDREIYSIKLSGNPKFGEGKPKNQNHAIIFTRGNVMQVIDMNQDNYFEAALKMRNLLGEFDRDHGFNSTLRQGNITHHEYIQVGNGRDVGLNQITLLEGKVAGGNNEQVLSRDVYRLGQILEFYQMMSFYFTTVSYYFCTMLTVLKVYIFLYGKAYLALFGVGVFFQGVASVTNNSALYVALNTQFLFQIGLFTVVPMVLGYILEQGFLPVVVSMQFQPCTVFFTFSLGTRTHYFGRTIMHGGAKYHATGRGFMVRHIQFSGNYRFYFRSHFVEGWEVVLLLIVYLAYGNEDGGALAYILLTISSWYAKVRISTAYGDKSFHIQIGLESFTHHMYFQDITLQRVDVSSKRLQMIQDSRIGVTMNGEDSSLGGYKWSLFKWKMKQEGCTNDLIIFRLNCGVSLEIQEEQLRIQEGICKAKLVIEHVDRPCNDKVLMSKLESFIFDPGVNYEETPTELQRFCFGTNS